LVGGEGPTLGAQRLGRARQSGDVAKDQAPANRLIQTLCQDDANPPHRGRGESAVALEREQTVDVVHVEIDEFLVPQSGQDMDPRDAHVVTQRTGLDLVAHDVLAPTLEEGGQGDVPVSGEKTVIELTLEDLEFGD